VSAAEQPRDISQLQARRRQARRRRNLARLDLGLGLLGAIVLILATPGLAIVALVALLVLALCALSIVLERRAARRSSRSDGSRSPSPGRRRLTRR
jgi:Flp pilus assembly protein TadB